MSNATEKSTAPGTPAAKPRNPVERVLVWGGIIALLVVVVIEYRAKAGYDASIKALNALSADETKELTFAEAQAALSMAPALSGPEVNGANSFYTYSWFSIFKSGKYQLTMTVSESGDADVDGKPVALMLGFTTPTPPEEVQPLAVAEAGEEAASSESFMPGGMGPPGGGFGSGGGGGGFGEGQRRPNPVRDSLDTDGDGAFSAEELANAAANILGKLDQDQDGALSAAELAPPVEGEASSDAPRPNRLVILLDKDEDTNLSVEELANAGTALLAMDADADGSVSGAEMRPPRAAGGGAPGGGESSNRPQRPAVDETSATIPAEPATPAEPAPPETETPAETTPAPETAAPVEPAAETESPSSAEAASN